MHPVSTPDNRDSLLLAALFRIGSAAWCFLPTDRLSEVLCSDAFLRFWNLSLTLNGNAQTNALSRDSLMQTLSLEGLDGELLFSPPMNPASECHCTVKAVCGHSRKLTIRFTALTAGDQVIGHIASCEESVESNLPQMLMKEIAAAQRKLTVLSAREREILELVYDGRTNKSISITTGISEKTVEKHRARIMQKLEITCTARMFRLVSKAWLLSDIPKLSNSSANGSNGTPPASTAPPVDSPE
jgi:DNA-binding CsgD family transcriptional regulator